MRIFIPSAAVIVIFGLLAAAGYTETKPAKAPAKPGEELFKEHCAACHADGGNIINPGKTLRKEHREAHNIITREDIVEKMRHPGKGMTSWSAATIPDQEAEAIADYIIRTFK